jgi:hypothetical protein
LPGFAEGIAEAVAKGISSIGDTIASKIKEAMPDFTPLTDAIKGMIKPLQDLQTWLANKLGNGDDEYSGTAVVENTRGKAIASKAYPGSFNIELANGDRTPAVNADDVEKYLGERPAGYAVGATFRRGGRFTGDVHPPEEIIPQAVASRGPGPIARALDALYGVTTGNLASLATSGAQTVEVHLHTSNDFSGMRVSSAVDIDRLMRDIDNRIKTGSVEAVKNAIGQRRT